jgi:hypothetical protein
MLLPLVVTVQFHSDAVRLVVHLPRDSAAARPLPSGWNFARPEDVARRIAPPSRATAQSLAVTTRSALDGSARLQVETLHRGAGDVTIAFGVGAYGRESRLEVFDVAGRRVAELAAAVPPPGRGVVSWREREMPGVYFVRLARPDTALMRRVVLLP